MTHDELIEAVAEKLDDWLGDTGTSLDMARAAIRVIAPAMEQETVAKIVAWLRDNSTPHNDIDEWADEIEAKWGKQ